VWKEYALIPGHMFRHTIQALLYPSLVNIKHESRRQLPINDFENAGDNFFLRTNYFMGHFKGYFEGAKTLLIDS
jgi:hypothetical protein